MSTARLTLPRNTGASGGIGRAMGERFAREGMKVALADVDQGALDDAAAKLRAC